MPNVKLIRIPITGKIQPSSDVARKCLISASIHGIRISAQKSRCQRADTPILPDCAAAFVSTAMIRLPLLPTHPFSTFISYSFRWVPYKSTIAPIQNSSSHTDHTIINTEKYQKQNPQTAVLINVFAT